MPLVEQVREHDAVRLIWRLGFAPNSVWSHVTDVERLAEWIALPLSGGFAIGQELVMDHGEGYVSVSPILASDPGRALTMGWRFPDEPPSTVDLTFEPTPSADQPTTDATHLTLTHTGLGELTGSYLPGWITHLTYLEASLHGDPLPFSAFWRLYETHDRLV